jgi:hypothetical protein
MVDEVEVRTRFCGEWVAGFEVVEQDEPSEHVRVRRRSDGTVLPGTFAPHEVRPIRSAGPRRGRRSGPR